MLASIPYSMRYITAWNTLLASIHYSMRIYLRKLTISKEAKHSFMVFIPRLWPIILTNDTVKLIRFSSSKNFLTFKIPNQYFWSVCHGQNCFQLCSKQTPSNLTLFAPPRPYIYKGRSDYHACYKKYLTKHSKQKHWTL